MNHDVMKAPTKEEALAAFFQVWAPEPESEIVPIDESLGRVTAQDIHAVNTIPAMRISAMDGYAVKSENFAAGLPDVSRWVQGVDYVSADTGDDFPDGYDTVIPVEQLHPDAAGVLTLEEDFVFQSGACIRPAGCMMKPGDLLAEKHRRITPELRANLAAGGIMEISVVVKPRVAFLPTGSELIAAGQTPTRGENIDTNSLMMADLLKSWGAEPVCYPIVRDDPAKLEQTLDEALSTCDIVLINGGSSKGSEDFNARMLERRASYFAYTVRTVPGRPVGIALIYGKAVINLPGPVFAAWVVGDWLVQAMIARWLGVPVRKRQQVTAFMTEDLRKGPPVEVYSMVQLEKRGSFLYATPLGREHRTSQMLRGQAILTAPVGQFGYEKGQPVTVELLCSESEIPVAEAAPHIQLPENCDQCGKHCPANQLSCGRGKAHLERLKNGTAFRSEDETANLLVACAHGITHMGTMKQRHGEATDNLLEGLDAAEQAQLLQLLQKQQVKMNADHAKHMAQHQGSHPGHPGHGRPPM